MLEHLYLNAESGFQLDPIFDRPEKPQKIKQLPNGGAPALPPPNGALIPPSHPTTAPGRKHQVSLREFIINLLERRAWPRKELQQHAVSAGYPKQYFGTCMWQLINKDESVKQTKDGICSLRRTGNGAKKAVARKQTAPQKAEPVIAAKEIALPREGSQDWIVLEELRRAYPDAVSGSNIKDHFVRLKRRRESASVSLHSLKKRGLIAHPSDGMYLYIPRPTPAKKEA